MKKIFTKVFSGYLIVVFLLSATIFYFSSGIIKEFYKDHLIEQLLNINNAIDSHVAGILLENNQSKLDSTVKNIGDNLKARITIIKTDGKVVADSKSDPLKMENHADRPEIIKALAEGKGYSIRHSHTVNMDMLYVAVPLKSNGKLLGVLRSSIYMDDFDSLVNSLRQSLIEILIAVMLVSLVIAFFMARTFTRPVKILTNLSNAVSKGDFNQKASLKNKDEFLLLANAFNDMIVKIRTLFEETNRRKEELINIISSLQEGLVVIDSDGKIKLNNASLEKIAGSGNVSGKFYWEVLREVHINKVVKKMLEDKKSLSTEVFYNDEFYICSGNYISNRNEIVLVFYNITELKKVENIKRDFVTNVSHELRTPLTVMKGYLETVEDQLDEKNKQYLQIVINHTNRLISIVRDLLSISGLEEKNIKLDFSEVDVKNLFENLNLTFSQKILERNLSISFEVIEGSEIINADYYKLEQLLINLVDNAIKYTEKGSIFVRSSIENDYIRFEVEDTGIGIPEIDKDRIFERFYTVDKSRSRQMDGTGLGLAIVKHIVNLMNGKIKVETTLGSGSKFIVQLPV